MVRERGGSRRHSRQSWKHFYEIEARLRELFEDVNHSVSAVVVEGKRDEEALREAGLRSPVVRFSSSGMPFFAFVEEMVEMYKGSTVLILLDFDQEGREMAEDLSQKLEEGGIRVEKAMREEVMRLLTKEGIMRVEEIRMLRKRASI